MNIIETTIPDVTTSNISKNKETIADSIIHNVYPLFDEVYNVKLEQVIRLRNKGKAGNRQMRNEKETMQRLVNAYTKEKKISKILDRIQKLVSVGLTYDHALQRETVILLKIIDKLSSEKLDQQLTKTAQTLNKRFSY